MNTQVQDAASMIVEIPNALRLEMRDFLKNNPDWDQNQVFNAALSLLLLQKGHMSEAVRRTYLDNIGL